MAELDQSRLLLLSAEEELNLHRHELFCFRSGNKLRGDSGSLKVPWLVSTRAGFNLLYEF